MAARRSRAETHSASLGRWDDEPEGRLLTWLEGRLAKQDIVSSKLSVVLGRCGYERQSAQRLSRMRGALDDAGIFARPQLLPGTLVPADRVWFSRRAYEPWEDGLTFPDEKALVDFIVNHHPSIPELATLWDPQTEFTIPHTHKRVDIMFRDSFDNYVVCEVKNGSGGLSAGGQLIGYLEAMEPVAEEDGVLVRGLLVTTEPNPTVDRGLEAQAKAMNFDVMCLLLVASVKVDCRVDVPAVLQVERTSR